MTISASPNVIIGGVPMPSLTAMAIGAAMKVVFKGLGKHTKWVPTFSRAGTRAAEEEAAAAARAAEREALIARTGGPQRGVDPIRAGRMASPKSAGNVQIPPNPPASLDHSKRYLWAVDAEGNVLIAAEQQDGFGRVLKHGDLTPGVGGTSRDPARAGGKLNFNHETARWEIHRQQVELHVGTHGRGSRHGRQSGSFPRTYGTMAGWIRRLSTR